MLGFDTVMLVLFRILRLVWYFIFCCISGKTHQTEHKSSIFYAYAAHPTPEAQESKASMIKSRKQAKTRAKVGHFKPLDQTGSSQATSTNPIPALKIRSLIKPS